MLLKFIFDRGTSLFDLIFLLPVLVIVGILIRIKMPGEPIILKQRGAGRYGRLFTIYKFRSVTAAHSGSSASARGESRITPLEAVLRKYKSDGLPELQNVLIGDVSFVRPCPDISGYTDRLEGENRRMLLLKPGMTDPASLKYQNEEELLTKQRNPQEYNDKVLLPDKVRLNTEYLGNWPFSNDVEFIIYTVLGRNL